MPSRGVSHSEEGAGCHQSAEMAPCGVISGWEGSIDLPSLLHLFTQSLTCPLVLAEQQPRSKQPADPARWKAQRMWHRCPEGSHLSEHSKVTLPVRWALCVLRKKKTETKKGTINKLEQFPKNCLGSVWPEGRI